MKKYSKLIVAAVIILVFIATFVFLYQKSQPAPIEYSELTPVTTDIMKTTVITGKIEPRNEVNVKPQISGIISEIYKEAGQYVQAGEVIARVKVIPDMGQLSSAQSRVRLAEINQKQAQVDYSREESLYKQKLVSADEYDKIRQTLHQANEELKAAQDALEVVRDGVSRSNAKASSTLIRSTISGVILDIPVKVDGAGEGIYTATFTAEWKESVNAAGLTVHTPVAGTGVFAGNSYEARAALDGETVSSAEFQAAAGQVIPDGDMESGSLPCFGKSTSESTTFWGSGNAATSGLCAQSTKPGMGGSYCAKLESQSAFGLLAAGNLFSATFRFANLSGTASFGMPYQWTARPTALRLKYHATVGAVNKGTVTEEHEYIQDGQDRSRIFAVIVDWNSRHATVAGMGSPTGVWDPAKTAETAEGPVIAYGSLLIGETTPGDAMTTVEIPIEYYDRTTKPTGAYTLIISCTTSAYGDFKVGCLGNVMYVDDFEWVY